MKLIKIKLKEKYVQIKWNSCVKYFFFNCSSIIEKKYNTIFKYINYYLDCMFRKNKKIVICNIVYVSCCEKSFYYKHDLTNQLSMMMNDFCKQWNFFFFFFSSKNRKSYCCYWCLAICLSGCFRSWLAHWLLCWLAHWLLCWLICWLAVWLVGWLAIWLCQPA